MKVYLVTLRSTGETWNHFVAASIDAALKTLKSYEITHKAHETEFYVEYDNPRDSSQTATITGLNLVE